MHHVRIVEEHFQSIPTIFRGGKWPWSTFHHALIKYFSFLLKAFVKEIPNRVSRLSINCIQRVVHAVRRRCLQPRRPCFRYLVSVLSRRGDVLLCIDVIDGVVCRLRISALMRFSLSTCIAWLCRRRILMVFSCVCCWESRNHMCHPTYLLFVSLNDLPRNIVPYIQKFGRNPVTGKPLALKDLIKLTFHKNADGRSKANVNLPAQGILIELLSNSWPPCGTRWHPKIDRSSKPAACFGDIPFLLGSASFDSLAALINPSLADSSFLLPSLTWCFSSPHTGEYHCPVLKKVFTEFTHIVAVKTTGNVFCYDVSAPLQCTAPRRSALQLRCALAWSSRHLQLFVWLIDLEVPNVRRSGNVQPWSRANWRTPCDALSSASILTLLPSRTVSPLSIRQSRSSTLSPRTGGSCLLKSRSLVLTSSRCR